MFFWQVWLETGGVLNSDTSTNQSFYYHSYYYYMATLRSLMKYFLTSSEKFLIPSGHVIFYLLVKYQWILWRHCCQRHSIEIRIFYMLPQQQWYFLVWNNIFLHEKSLGISLLYIWHQWWTYTHWPVLLIILLVITSRPLISCTI